MTRSRDLVVADTSPLILLGRTKHLDWLSALFQAVLIPPRVLEEATGNPTLPGAKAVLAAVSAGLIEVVAVDDSERTDDLAALVDPGEAEAIALALQRRARIVLMDDRVGRRVARGLGLRPLGTAGIALLAVRRGVHSDLGEALDELSEAGLRLSEGLMRSILERLAQE